MKGIRIALLSISTVISAQSVSDVLLRYPELSKLSSYVPAFPEWSASLEAANNFTLLAPSNDAISTWLAASSPPNSTIVATLLYHLLEGSRPLTSFNNQSIFIPTALSNATYANVTGGQRVLATNDGHLAFESGNKTTSNVTTADLISTGGIIHIIDTVLEMPQDELSTITTAKLSYFIDIINQGNFITVQNGAFVQNFDTMTDATFLAPNSAAALGSFNPTGLNQSTLDTLFEYHVIHGVMYSTNFTNGSTLTTAAGIPVIVTLDDSGEIYINSAKITAPDYLISNGVMHVLDSVLDPSNITRPAGVTSSSSTTTAGTAASSSVAYSSTDGLSTGAKAGIGVGASVVIIAAVLLVYLLTRHRRKNCSIEDTHPRDPELSYQGLHEVPQLETKEPPVETGEPLRHELG